MGVKGSFSLGKFNLITTDEKIKFGIKVSAMQSIAIIPSAN